jgi:hypothetical protein
MEEAKGLSKELGSIKGSRREEGERWWWVSKGNDQIIVRRRSGRKVFFGRRENSKDGDEQVYRGWRDDLWGHSHEECVKLG